MVHFEGMLLEKNLLLFLFGILVWFCPLSSCRCLNHLTVLNLKGMQATQVSNYQHFAVSFTADRAIDGDLRTSASDFSCAHTQENRHPWWKVDLGTNHCLGRITLVNRGDCCNKRLSGAIVRAGIGSDIFNNAACGVPVTSDQASIPGGHIPISCNPPVLARYVSVDIETPTLLAMCEVIVEEYPMEYCFQAAASTGMVSSLLFEGKCIANPRPLSDVLMKSPMHCFMRCKMISGCLSFDYVMTSGQCKLYDVKAGDLKTDDQPGCLVYAVVRG
ncbi:uncharacterized protein [Asterias amurensis]|uniref:uncharacterized protein n=1 Tax=Asterias amurensis TaxID=7602 RepID=UPI003AB6E7E9